MATLTAGNPVSNVDIHAYQTLSKPWPLHETWWHEWTAPLNRAVHARLTFQTLIIHDLRGRVSLDLSPDPPPSLATLYAPNIGRFVR